MKSAAAKFRGNFSRILDDVSRTGTPVEIERKGRVLRIAPAEGNDKLSRLKVHAGYLGVEPEAIVHVDWSKEWRP